MLNRKHSDDLQMKNYIDFFKRLFLVLSLIIVNSLSGNVLGKCENLLSSSVGIDYRNANDTIKTKVILGAITNAGITSVNAGLRIESRDPSLVRSTGICWNIEPNPTVDDFRLFIETDTAGKTTIISDLVPKSVYFIRAFAVTEDDTIYSDQNVFYTHRNDAVRDYDGNYYNHVEIGSQTWLAEDLKVTHLTDGTPISRITDNSEWVHSATPAWCWYANDSVMYSFPRGKLYNWFAVGTGKLCPEGWHVPSDNEWLTLQNYLGGDTIAGGKLKTTGTLFWRSPNIGATNETGFSAIPGGYRDGSGMFSYVTMFDRWWSNDEYSSGAGNSYYVYHFQKKLYYAPLLKQFGNSVRCIKD
jgi:uncharacterized protein (TIGR02145 family)